MSYIQQKERRRHRRVPINLGGRLMLTTRREVACRAVDMSPGGLSLEAAVNVRRGERIIAYIDEIGRVEGTVARITRDGFAMTVTATSHKREKLAATLTFQASREELEIEDMRSAPRVAPQNRATEIVFADGTTYVARLVDESVSGGAAISKAPISVGMKVWIGGRCCLVLRSGNLEHAFRYI